VGAAALWAGAGPGAATPHDSLLLLSILLSSAPRPVRLAFLAGVPGEVLLRLLGEVAAGEEGVAQEGSAATHPLGHACSFHQWQAPGAASPGALGLADALAQTEGVVSQTTTRQAVLQVLLWCFCVVVPPLQLGCSSRSSSGGVHAVGHAQQLLLAAQRGALWAPCTGEGRDRACWQAPSASSHWLGALTVCVVDSHTQ
jgi:hypothetical protein